MTLAISSGAKREESLPAAVTNADAAVHLHRFYEAENKKEKVVNTASGQFSLTVLEKPRRYFTSCCILVRRHEKDAEQDEKARWVSELAALLKGTETPTRRPLVEKPENATLLGGGRRASTLGDSMPESFWHCWPSLLAFRIRRNAPT